MPINVRRAADLGDTADHSLAQAQDGLFITVFPVSLKTCVLGMGINEMFQNQRKVQRALAFTPRLRCFDII